MTVLPGKTLSSEQTMASPKKASSALVTTVLRSLGPEGTCRPRQILISLHLWLEKAKASPE